MYKSLEGGLEVGEAFLLQLLCPLAAKELEKICACPMQRGAGWARPTGVRRVGPPAAAPHQDPDSQTFKECHHSS